jgi:hypothetical protein
VSSLILRPYFSIAFGVDNMHRSVHVRINGKSQCFEFMPTPAPCVPCCTTPQLINIPGVDGADGAPGPNSISAATATTLTGILAGSGGLVVALATPLAVANGGTGYAVNGNRYAFTFTSDPALTAITANPVAMGLGDPGNGLGAIAKITMATTGTFLILLTAIIKNSAGGDGATAQLYYGSGPGPVNGALLAGGTAMGSAKKFVQPTGAGAASAIALAYFVTGLLPATNYWLDVGLNAVAAGNASISDIDLLAIEL